MKTLLLTALLSSLTPNLQSNAAVQENRIEEIIPHQSGLETRIMGLELDGKTYYAPFTHVNSDLYTIIPTQSQELNAEMASIEDITNSFPLALAGINGGFYEPNLEPSGLIIKNGEKLHESTSYGGSGVFLLDKEGQPKIMYLGEIPKDNEISQAMQSGPVLVRNEKDMLAGRDLKQSSYIPTTRSVIAITPSGDIEFGVINNINLPDLSKILSQTYSDVLNLDGGPSSSMFFGEDRRIFGSKSKVQNFLLVYKK